MPQGGPPGSSLGRPAEKAKNFGQTLKRLMGYLRPISFIFPLSFYLP